jgi:hypothetical protein
VHLAADAVAHVVLDDAVLAGRPDAALHRVRDVRQSRAGPGGGQALPQRPLAVADQLGDPRGDGTDTHRQRGVGVPPADAGAAVDGHQIAVPQDPRRARDAMHDLVVDTGADRRGEAVVTEERRDGPGGADPGAGDGVQVGGADTGCHGVRGRPQGGRDHLPRFVHQRQLRLGLDLHARLALHPHGASGSPLTVPAAAASGGGAGRAAR